MTTEIKKHNKQTNARHIYIIRPRKAGTGRPATKPNSNLSADNSVKRRKANRIGGGGHPCRTRGTYKDSHRYARTTR